MTDLAGKTFFNERIQVNCPSKKKFMYCLNCNKKGHKCKNCKYPTNSYGKILFKYGCDDVIRYLLIQRKYTSVYVELLRAKYDNGLFDHQYLILLIQGLPLTERYNILEHEFDYLWKKHWRWVGTDEQMEYIQLEYNKCEKAYNSLKQGYIHPDYGFLSFNDLFEKYPPQTIEPDWEFPKGRRILGESDQECANRECFEETTLSNNDYYSFLHVKPFQEKYTGINQIKYCNNYYLAEFTNKNKMIYYDPSHIEQNKEIRKIGWFTLNETKKLIGQTYKHRIKILEDVETLINNLKKKQIH